MRPGLLPLLLRRRGLASASSVPVPVRTRLARSVADGTAISRTRGLTTSAKARGGEATAASPCAASTLYQARHRGPPPSEMVAFMERLRHAGHGSVDLVVSDKDDRVLELWLRNEKSRNSLTGRMMMQLHDLALELTSPSSRYRNACALIIRGEGSTLCSGADFHLAGSISTPEEGTFMCELMTSTLTRLRRAPLISVACLGNALGGGAEFATAADYRVMAPMAKVQFVQARMGVSPGWGGAARLVRLVGRREALHLLAGAVQLDADLAYQIGFADDLCREKEELMHAAWRFLVPFLRHTPSAVRSIKMSVAAADDLDWHHTREVEMAAFKMTWGSEANKHALETAKARIAEGGGRAAKGERGKGP